MIMKKHYVCINYCLALFMTRIRKPKVQSNFNFFGRLVFIFLQFVLQFLIQFKKSFVCP